MAFLGAEFGWNLGYTLNPNFHCQSVSAKLPDSQTAAAGEHPGAA